MSDSLKLLLKSTEAALRLGISPSTLHRWVKAGKIDCIYIERNAIYFTPEALETFVHRNRRQYQPRNPA